MYVCVFVYVQTSSQPVCLFVGGSRLYSIELYPKIKKAYVKG